MAALRRNLMIAATALALVGCAGLGNLTSAPKEKDYTALSGQLKKDMTEVDVTMALGSSPDKTDLVQCRDHEGNPWQCRTWIFAGGGSKNTLRLVFYQTNNKDWRVATWEIY
jgi:hypothetical protein